MPDKLLHGIGHTYNLLYKIPRVGDPLVRGISKSVAFMNHHLPGSQKEAGSVEEFRKGFEEFAKMVGLNYELGPQDEKTIVILVNRCPYGWDKPKQHEVCDAAMDMDRKMFGYAGMDLDIQERIVDGAPACKFLFTRR